MERKRLRHLADVNVLLAGVWKFLPQHRISLEWLTHHPWAFCSVTEIGFIRISLQPAFQQRAAIDALLLGGIFRELAKSCRAARWSQVRPFHDSPLLGPDVTAAQVTDAYLCDLASQHRGKLATLDDRLHRLYPDHTTLIETS